MPKPKREVRNHNWQEIRDLGVLADTQKRREAGRLRPLTDGQGVYIGAIKSSVITLCTGPAGSGKSFCSTTLAVQMLRDNAIKKIVFTRPLVNCSGRQKGMGTLPGQMAEKAAPYMRPIFDVLNGLMSGIELEKHFREKTIEVIPLDVMRGLSLDQTVLVADEMQNAEYEQIRMLLTRFGKNSRVVVSGDATQTDLPHDGTNPLLRSMHRLRGIKEISLVYLKRCDIVRHPLIQLIEERMGDADTEHDGDEFVRDHQTWYALRCPRCDAKVWYNNGDQNDPTMADVEYVRCWHCLGVLSTPEYDGDKAQLVHEQADVTRGVRVP